MSKEEKEEKQKKISFYWILKNLVRRMFPGLNPTMREYAKVVNVFSLEQLVADGKGSGSEAHNEYMTVQRNIDIDDKINKTTKGFMTSKIIKNLETSKGRCDVITELKKLVTFQAPSDDEKKYWIETLKEMCSQFKSDFQEHYKKYPKSKLRTIIDSMESCCNVKDDNGAFDKMLDLIFFVLSITVIGKGVDEENLFKEYEIRENLTLEEEKIVRTLGLFTKRIARVEYGFLYGKNTDTLNSLTKELVKKGIIFYKNKKNGRGYQCELSSVACEKYSNLFNYNDTEYWEFALNIVGDLAKELVDIIKEKRGSHPEPPKWLKEELFDIKESLKHSLVYATGNKNAKNNVPLTKLEEVVLWANWCQACEDNNKEQFKDVKMQCEVLLNIRADENNKAYINSQQYLIDAYKYIMNDCANKLQVFIMC